MNKSIILEALRPGLLFMLPRGQNFQRPHYASQCPNKNYSQNNDYSLGTDFSPFSPFFLQRKYREV